MRPELFFASLRSRKSGVFGTSLSQSQVDGINAVLDAGQGLPLSHLSYALGTAYGETGGRMQPVTENMNYSARRIPDVFSQRRLKGETPAQLAGKPEKLANVVYSDMLGNGDIASGDGWRYRGHGLVQLTGKDNFRRMGGRIGVDLVARPDLALRMDIAAKALIAGIKDGIYTGKSASNYLPAIGRATGAEYVQARRIINGTFEAAKYAGFATAFEAALIAGGYDATSAPTRPATPLRPPSAPQRPAPAKKGFLDALLSRLLRFLNIGGPS